MSEGPPSQARALTSPGGSVTQHYLRYLNANLFMAVAGVVSLPVLSRLLTKEDFGILGYFETLGLIWVALLKLGLAHSITRYFASHCLNKTEREQEEFFTTLVWAPSVLSWVVSTITTAGLLLIHLVHPLDNPAFVLVYLALSEIAVLTSFRQNVMLAGEQSALLSTMNIVGRWARTILGLLAVWVVRRDALGVLIARLVADLLVLVWTLAWSRQTQRFKAGAFNPALLKAALVYGAPLALAEVSAVFLYSIDRVILKVYLDFDAVGTYDLNYSVATYLGMVLQSSLGPAFTPVANRVFEQQGRQGVLGLQKRVLRVLYYMSVGLTVAVIVLGSDLLALVVSPAKADREIFSWIAVTYLFTPLLAVATHALMLEKRTTAVLAALAASSLANVLLNFILIPRLGVMGAVYATLLSFGVLAGVELALCPPDFVPWPRFGDLARPFACGVLLYSVAIGSHLFGSSNIASRLAIFICLGLILFLLPAGLMERDLTSMLLEKLRGKPENELG